MTAFYWTIADHDVPHVFWQIGNRENIDLPRSVFAFGNRVDHGVPG